MISHNLARSGDGSLQITFTIPCETIKKEEEKLVEEEAKKMQIPGFRQGRAPKEKIAEKISKEDQIQSILSRLLPAALSEAISQEKLTLAIYPKLELISAKENEPWQIRATSCELPAVELGNYQAKPTKKLTAEEKETWVIKQILDSSQIKIPQLLLDEEVNSRLANLLQRTERLGLSLESYLSSINKTVESLRTEYAQQSKEAITLELALNKIADQEKIEVSQAKIDQAIKASSTDPKLAEELKKPEKQRVLASILRRQQTISHLKNLL